MEMQFRLANPLLSKERDYNGQLGCMTRYSCSIGQPAKKLSLLEITISTYGSLIFIFSGNGEPMSTSKAVNMSFKLELEIVQQGCEIFLIRGGAP